MNGTQSIAKEELGKDKYTDFWNQLLLYRLCRTYFWCTFKRFVYLKLDRQLGKLIKELDDEIGRDYILYLTADHGASGLNHLFRD